MVNLGDADTKNPPEMADSYHRYLKLVLLSFHGVKMPSIALIIFTAK